MANLLEPIPRPLEADPREALVATRMITNEQLGKGGPVQTEHTPAMARRSGDATRRSFDHVLAVSVTDRDQDEELFAPDGRPG